MNNIAFLIIVILLILNGIIELKHKNKSFAVFYTTLGVIVAGFGLLEILI